MADLISSMAQFGIAGLIFSVLVYVIIKPAFDNLIETNKKKDEYIQKLIGNHFEHDEQRQNALIKALEDLPAKTGESVMRSVTKIYPVDFYKKASKAVDKILRE